MNKAIDINACKRLVRIKEIKKMTWQQMADEIGVKESTLRQISSGRLDLSRKMCNKVCDHFQEFNIEWLLTGNGNMYVDGLEPKDEKDKYYGWTSSQLIRLIEQKDELIDAIKKNAELKNELINSLKEQLSLYKEMNPQHVEPYNKKDLEQSSLLNLNEEPFGT